MLDNEEALVLESVLQITIIYYKISLLAYFLF